MNTKKSIFILYISLWLFISIILLLNYSNITAHIISASAQGGYVTELSIEQSQSALQNWKALYGRIYTEQNINANNSITLTNTSNQSITIHNLYLENACTGGNLIITQEDTYTPIGIQEATHTWHNTFLNPTDNLAASESIFTIQREYTIRQYTVNLYTAQTNGNPGIFYQGFGRYLTNSLFYIIPYITYGFSYNGHFANFQVLLPTPQNQTTYYFYFDDTNCISQNDTEEEIEQRDQINLALEFPEKSCVNQTNYFTAIDLNNRLFCLDPEHTYSSSECREIGDLEIDIYHENDLENAFASVSTDEFGLANFLPTQTGYYTFKTTYQEKTYADTTFVGKCENYEPIIVKSYFENYEEEKESIVESPSSFEQEENTLLTPVQKIIAWTIWILLTTPLSIAACILYYNHYKNSSKWLLKLRIYLKEAKKRAEEKI